MKEDTCIFIVIAVLQALFTKAARFGETGKKNSDRSCFQAAWHTAKARLCPTTNALALCRSSDCQGLLISLAISPGCVH